jgi:hypothetical protein
VSQWSEGRGKRQTRDVVARTAVSKAEEITEDVVFRFGYRGNAHDGRKCQSAKRSDAINTTTKSNGDILTRITIPTWQEAKAVQTLVMLSHNV